MEMNESFSVRRGREFIKNWDLDAPKSVAESVDGRVEAADPLRGWGHTKDDLHAGPPSAKR
jgi:hypothetical protein